ncbi:alpha-ketoacid dehydrogenase subunit alpha/beta [Natronococcus wangiae]|uniref:alpha-ketoacid dehydrogenase subunit alpha/beta n=1 Tax=Natronococcus wangiae TaxID=3068275 RepID=UPI00273EECAB|nr:thiamine pyrophosphate-dependent enzyme [Natronococcus sp. AD5]
MTWTEKRPSEDFYQVLEPDGSIANEPPNLDEEELLSLYRTLRLTRTLEEKMLKMQRRGQLSLVAHGFGEEATPLGSAAALEPGDWCFPYYRQKPARLYWEEPPAAIIAGRMGFEPETVGNHIDADTPVNFTTNYTPLGVNVTNAAGSAMADAFTDGDAVSMAYIGDGATSEGDFHEALNFVSVFDAPLVTICQNNQWAISVPAHRQTASETFAQKATAYGMPGERVDGNDVLAVYEKSREAVERARAGEGPTLIECVTYRMADHNTSDAANVYRDDSEREYWADRDPIDRFETYLEDQGILGDGRRAEIEDDVQASVEAAVDAVEEISESNPSLMFEHHLHESGWKDRHQRTELAAELAGENPFTDFTGDGLDAQTDRSVTDGAGASTAASGRPSDAETEEMNLVTAINETLRQEMARDERVRLLGYDIGEIGGVFRTTEGLLDEFGGDRVIDTPLTQTGVLGTAVGMAMRGEHPVPEVQFMGFLYPAFGQFMHALVKTFDRTAGSIEVPVTVRLPYGGGIKASEYHSESTETYLIHTPGVKVVCPSTPAEAKGLLASSIRDPDPVMFMEPKKIYREGKEPVPTESYTLPYEARIIRAGEDITLVTWGRMLHEALPATDEVDADVEVIDLRVLSPLDIETVLDSVKKTGRCVVFHEARRTLGLGAELSALINEYALDRLLAPVKRATGYDVHFPGHQLEEAYLPDADRARYALEAVMGYEI